MKEELAKTYSSGKAMEALDKAIEAAYLEGYKQGYADCRKHMFTVDGIEYADFELPSGTLWSKTPVMDPNGIVYMSWEEAQRYSIPTPEQVEELMSFCEAKPGKNLTNVIFSDKDSISTYEDIGVMEDGEIHNSGTMLWLKGTREDPDYGQETITMHIYTGSVKVDARPWGDIKLPVFLVRLKSPKEE